MIMAKFPSCVWKWILTGVCSFISLFQIVSSACLSPPKPFGTSYNGTTGAAYVEGTTITYSCLVGFSIDEDSDRVRKCLRDGTWTGRDEVCHLNFFDVFISLVSAVGVVLIFVFLVCCRLHRQRKRGSSKIKADRKKAQKAKKDAESPPEDLLNNNPSGLTENPYEMTGPNHTNPASIEYDYESDEGTINKAFTNGDLNLDDSDKPGYETHTDNDLDHVDDGYLKPSDQEREEQDYLKPSDHKLQEEYLKPNGQKSKQGQSSKHAKRGQSSEHAKHGNSSKHAKGHKSKHGHSAKGLKPGPLADMVNASPLYYTPSFDKQGTGWIHDDTSFDSLDLETFDEKPEKRKTKSK